LRVQNKEGLTNHDRKQPHLILSNGIKMPIIGYGVYRIRSAATAELVPENIDVCDFRGGLNPDHFGSDKIK